MSLPEVILWQVLRARPGGFRFRRQYPLEPWTFDFACLSARLAIEVDGEAHNRGDRPQRDEARDADLKTRGFHTIRIPARMILSDLDAAVRGIVQACEASSIPLPETSSGRI